MVEIKIVAKDKHLLFEDGRFYVTETPYKDGRQTDFPKKIDVTDDVKKAIMPKTFIDIEKFICSYLSILEKCKEHTKGIEGLKISGRYQLIIDLLKQQGIIYKDGSLIKIGSKKCEGKLKEMLDEKVLANSCESCKNETPHRFKVGDWLVHKDMVGVTCCITQINEPYYYLTENNSFINFGEEDNFRPWTIRDAKPGDVLADDRAILLFRSIGNRNWKNVISYYAILETNLNNRFSISDDEEYWGKVEDCELKPASKEQRDTLMKAMADAVYTFDFEKKEPRKLKFRIGDEIKTDNEESLTITKIDEKGYWSKDLFICGFDDTAKWELVEQKPAWSEDDETVLNNLIWALKEHMVLAGDRDEYVSWLQSLKDKTIPQPKQEWSEEDVNFIEATIGLLNLVTPIDAASWGKSRLDCVDWLKSLKDKVGREVNCTTTKEWSEEDETNASYICSALECHYRLREERNNTNGQEDLDKAKNWLYNRLKSIEPQSHWKPSDKQIMALRWVLNHIPYDSHKEEISGLLEQLKKLKGK